MLDDIFHTIFHTHGEGTHQHTAHENMQSDPYQTEQISRFYTGEHSIPISPGQSTDIQHHLQNEGLAEHRHIQNEYTYEDHVQGDLGHIHHQNELHHQTHRQGENSYEREAAPPVYEPNWNPAIFNGIGHPQQYSHYWQHQTGEDCAVIAQGEILESITGIHLTEQQLCQIAQSHGWYDPQKGTMPENIGNILSYEGIPVTHTDHATIENLAQALSKDQRVIVGINANEIWHPQHDPITGEPQHLPYAGHAVWVTGIHQEPDGSIKVILTDSAPENGQVEVVDVHDFLNAWSDSGNLMVTTDSYPAA